MNHHKTPTTPPFALPKVQLGACIFEPVWRKLCDSRQCEKGSDVMHPGQESHSARLAAPPDLAGIIISPTVLMRKQRHREVELLALSHQQVVKPVLEP